jgi:hypothetical protein
MAAVARGMKYLDSMLQRIPANSCPQHIETMCFVEDVRSEVGKA